MKRSSRRLTRTSVASNQSDCFALRAVADNSQGSGKGQMAAWKSAKAVKLYEEKGGSYEQKAGSKNEPAKGKPEPKSSAKVLPHALLCVRS